MCNHYNINQLSLELSTQYSPEDSRPQMIMSQVTVNENVPL